MNFLTRSIFYTVEKAALVFSLKLDNGHRLLCPWIDNACSETVARFPPITPPLLVDNFRERCSALLQLSALPRISSSAMEHIQSPLLDNFLGQSLTQESGNGSTENSGMEDAGSQEERKLYYQVLTGFFLSFLRIEHGTSFTIYNLSILAFYVATGLLHFIDIFKKCYMSFCLGSSFSKQTWLGLLFFCK